MRRQTILAAVSSLAIVAALAGPAFAQEAQPLAPGAEIEGEISANDATAPDRSYRYDSYAVTATAGQRFEVIMRSDDFDAYLQVHREGENAGTPLASDDDGLGEGTDSRLRFTASSDGVYVVRARPLSGLAGGAYTLSLTEREPAAPPPEPKPITLGETVEGEIAAGDPEDDQEVPYHAWAFSGARGDRVAIALDSEAFDPMLRVGRMTDGAFTELAANDDGPDSGLNSRLVFTLPEAGTFVIRAAPLSTGRTGAYSLTLSEGPPPLQAQAIAMGDTVRGQLTEDDGVSASSGSYADAYRFSGQEGQRVRIDMTSSQFDTYLELFDEDQNSLASDDDGGPEGTNSRLIFTLPRTGSYVFEARAFSQSTGAYRVALTEVEPDKPPRPLEFGASLQGEIGDNSSRDDQDRGYDAFVFEGREGQRVRAIMRSGDFDTYLQIGNAEGDFSALASDDVGRGEGTDARLNFTLPADGRYVLRALPLGSNGKGLYSLELQDRGPQPQAGSILIGTTARGTLTETDATADDNSFYDAYRITLKEGEEVRIKMVSNEVDSFLIIGRDTDGSFEPLGSDDDGLADTHAKLEWEAPEDGTYEIRAGTYAQGQTGAYALIVEKKP